MILTSPSEDAGQTPPVTTTFDAPSATSAAAGPRRTLRHQVDWDRVERLHGFVRARSLQRLREAQLRRDYQAQRAERDSLHAIEAMADQAHSDALIAACAITFFRARALRDADHPEFLGEWIDSRQLASKTA